MTRPALGRADVVIADRFLYSAEVLARHGRGLPEALAAAGAATRPPGGCSPDLVVLVDVDPHIARARRRVAKLLTARPAAPSRKGLGGVGMQHRFRAGYRELAAARSRAAGWWSTTTATCDATVDLVAAAASTAARRGAGGAAAGPRRARPPPAAAPLPATDLPTALDRFLRLDRRAHHAASPTPPPTCWAACAAGRRRAPARAAARPRPRRCWPGAGRPDDPVSWEIRDALADRPRAGWPARLGGLAQPHPRGAALRAALAARVAARRAAARATASTTTRPGRCASGLQASTRRSVVARWAGCPGTRAWAAAGALAGRHRRRGGLPPLRERPLAWPLADRAGRRPGLALRKECARRPPPPPSAPSIRDHRPVLEVAQALPRAGPQDGVRDPGPGGRSARLADARADGPP